MDFFIIGKAGSGKDTLANILEEYYYKPFALADSIREEFKRFYPDLNPRTNRKTLQDIGQFYKQLYGEDVWCRTLETKINEFKTHDIFPFVVITDGRFSIEYDYFVNKRHFIPLRMKCPDEQRLERLLKRDGTLQPDALKRESTELDDVFAYEIDNSNGRSCLDEQVKNLIQKIKKETTID